MNDWEEAVAFALALPGTALSTSYGSFAAASPLGEKELLIETDPDTFWESDHYRGWPAVLVRYDSADPERIRHVITRAWWDKAPRALRKQFGDRP